MNTKTRIVVRLSRIVLAALLLPSLVAGCGGSSSDSGADGGCTGFCANATTFLTVQDIERIISQAVAEATARGAPATIAVVDRVGNVLGVFRMNGADPDATITSGRGVVGGLEGIAIIPDTLAAIAKAITGAYLSSEGNAFTTRTANQIVQEHFNPGEVNQPGGPLFGVQFSQLPCSDLNTRFTVGADAGPKRSPLGLSADSGGLPLYKGGTPVGGIGVISDGIYGLDLNIGDLDRDNDELIAMAGTFGLAAPIHRRADRITVEGKTFRFADVSFENLVSNPAAAPDFNAAIDGVLGTLVSATGYFGGAIIAGTAFGQPASGIRADTLDYPGLDAFVLVDSTDTERFRPIAGTDGMLTAGEVREIVRSGLDVANRARAQIRRPIGSQARVTVSVVDTNGVILGIARTRDAPVFGTDVSLQKARTAAFFSNANAAADLTAAPNTIYRNADGSASGVQITIGDYVTDVRNFLGLPTALADGAFAFSDRAGGNLSRPFFPDGIVGAPNGPLSKPFPSWSPFTDGLQLDLVMNEVVTHVLFVAGAGPDTGMDCTNTAPPGRIPNGIQIFPGSVPIYKGFTLAGGIGISGDGVDQDDLVAFLGLHNAGVTLATVNNAPPGMRADNITEPVSGLNLRFVQCPQTPFLGSNEQEVCAGK